MSARDGEKRIICPYNKAHELLHYRVQTHLVRCRRNYPETKMVDCVYNHTHRVYEPELKFHYENCADRIGMDKFIFVPETVNTDKFPVPQLDLQPEDDWDDEADVPTYNPEEACKDKAVIRMHHTLSAAQRRNFRMEERKRIQKLENEQAAMDREELRESEVQAGQRQRRPVVQSAGYEAIRSDGPRDINSLMERINLSSQPIVPKLGNQSGQNRDQNGAAQSEFRDENDENAQRFDNDYPTLGGPSSRNRDGDADSGSWATVTRTKVARGRGRGVAQQKR